MKKLFMAIALIATVGQISAEHIRNTPKQIYGASNAGSYGGPNAGSYGGPNAGSYGGSNAGAFSGGLRPHQKAFNLCATFKNTNKPVCKALDSAIAAVNKQLVR